MQCVNKSSGIVNPLFIHSISNILVSCTSITSSVRPRYVATHWTKASLTL